MTCKLVLVVRCMVNKSPQMFHIWEAVDSRWRASSQSKFKFIVKRENLFYFFFVLFSRRGKSGTEIYNHSLEKGEKFSINKSRRVWCVLSCPPRVPNSLVVLALPCRRHSWDCSCDVLPAGGCLRRWGRGLSGFRARRAVGLEGGRRELGSPARRLDIRRWWSERVGECEALMLIKRKQ